MCLEYACEMQRIISVTDLVRNAARIAEELATEDTVYRITRGGRGSMVLVSEEYFNGWVAAIEEMQRPGWKHELEQARRDAAAGRGRTLDEVAKELGLEDTSRRKRRTPATRPARPRGAKSGKGATRPRSRAA